MYKRFLLVLAGFHFVHVGLLCEFMAALYNRGYMSMSDIHVVAKMLWSMLRRWFIAAVFMVPYFVKPIDGYRSERVFR